MYIQRGVEVLASRMVRCETLVREPANGIKKRESCSGVWLRIAGAWEQLLRSDARTLETQRMCCYEG